jgi:hypothetical protein
MGSRVNNNIDPSWSNAQEFFLDVDNLSVKNIFCTERGSNAEFVAIAGSEASYSDDGCTDLRSGQYTCKTPLSWTEDCNRLSLAQLWSFNSP